MDELLEQSARAAARAGVELAVSTNSIGANPSFRLDRIKTAEKAARLEAVSAAAHTDGDTVRPQRPANYSNSGGSGSSPRHRLRSTRKPTRRSNQRSSLSDQRLGAVLGTLGTAGPAVQRASDRNGDKDKRRVQQKHIPSASIHVSYVHTPCDPRLNLAAHSAASPASPARGQKTAAGADDEDVRDRLRMASALNKLGINLGQEIIDQWMSHESYDGARSFGSLAVLYEIRLAELLAAIPRTVGRLPGNYPNKVRTALVLGIFRQLSQSNALGKYRSMLQSILSTVIDAIYVCSVRELPSGDRLNTSHFGQAATWYDMTRAQAQRITSLEAELAIAANHRKRFLAHKKMQQRVLERVVERWKHALTSRVFHAWQHWWLEAKRVRELIKTIVARKYFRRDRELLRITWVAWSAYTRSAVDARLRSDGWSDVEEKSLLEAELEELREQRNAALQLLRDTATSFRAELDKLRLAFQARLELALASQASILTTAIEEATAQGAKQGTASIPRRDASTQVGFAGTRGGDAGELGDNDEKKKKEETPPSPPKAKKKKKKKKPYKGRTLNAAKVLDTIAAMYEKKIKADAIDDQAGKDRDTLEEFAEDFFMQMYGTVMMKKKTAEFKHSVGVHKKDNIRIKWFSTFVGWNAPDAFGMETPFSENAIHAFLGVLSELFPVDAIEERLDDDPCLVSVTGALKALGTDGDGLFDSKHRAAPSFAALVQTLKANSVTVKGRSSTDRFVDFDLCMNLVMKEWYMVVVNKGLVGGAAAAAGEAKRGNEDVRGSEGVEVETDKVRAGVEAEAGVG